ncbi:ATP-binding cassette domain-containing protein [Candidatus Saccharibacteria bacterium]|nr:ATP-binding cassette domain-containing protein [Candidatus Saccharibacteria bacterium]
MLDLQNIVFMVKNGTKKRTVIDDLSLKIKAGEFVVITGPNGSGKSTLAKIIMGINKPTSGQIIFDKQDITQMSITDRAKLGIVYSFQQPLHFKGLTVKDLLQVAATGQETFLKDNKTNYKKLLETVGLGEEYLNREINNSLSGGELKRIEIASVLARNAKLMVFDEPEAGIDIWSFSRLVNVFQKLRKDHTIIVISHQKRIIDIADRVVIIRDGKISKEDLAS